MEGRRCDRCKENKYDRQRGCVDCPACYNLVQSAANDHRAKLQELEKVLSNIASNPTVISDQDFERKLKEAQGFVEELWNDAKHRAGSMSHIKICLACFTLLGETWNSGTA